MDPHALNLPVVADITELAKINQDFGKLCLGTAAGIVKPSSIKELQQIVEYAHHRSIQLTLRGSGLSQGGQSLAAHSLTLDLQALNQLEPVNKQEATIVCHSGASWRQVVQATAPYGLLPCVLPFNLDLTVGGVLSVGGIGATSHQYGPIVGNVLEMEVVTGGGESLTASRHEHTPLFQAVLAGLGRCGIIAQAKLQLRPIKPKVRTFYLLYDDPNAWLNDQQQLALSGQVQYMEAFCAASIQGLRNSQQGRSPFATWLYPLHISVEYETHAPSLAQATTGLRYWRHVHTEDNDTVSFTERYAPRFAQLHKTGAWQQKHPWLECFLPASTLHKRLPELLNQIPLALGDGHRVFYINKSQAPDFFMLPEEEAVFELALLPAGVADYHLTELLNILAQINSQLLAEGGKRYLAGWLGNMDDAAWRQHYGKHYTAWHRAKQQFDPQHIFTSLLFKQELA